MAVKKASKKGKTAAKPAAAKKIAGVKKSYTKGQTFTYMAERSNLKRQQVAVAMLALNELIEAHLRKQGPGNFTLPGVLKFKLVRKPATKARKGINPFTGEMTTFKAKPARNVIKIRALKKLKDTVQ